MGSVTAQILAGTGHPDDGGIIPTHFLFLSEGARPVWTLVPQSLFPRKGRKKSEITWIPAGNMVEDALLMIATHICRNEKILALGKSCCEAFEADSLDLATDLKPEDRVRLYEECRRIEAFPKIIVTYLRHSSVEFAVAVLREYRMEVEVCGPFYSRIYSGETKEIMEDGAFF